jgi:hypothetical protein
VDLRALVARHYPDVLTEGVGGGATITFAFSPEGAVLGHTLNRDPPPEAGSVIDDTVAMPPRIGSGLDEREMDTSRIEDIDVVRFNAGQMGPDPVRVALVWMGPPRFPAGPGSDARPRPAQVGFPVSAVLRNADEPRMQQPMWGLMRKHWPAGLPEGADRRVNARFVLDAAGKPREIEIVNQPHPAVAEAARKVLAEMVFLPAKEGHTMRFGFEFSREEEAGPPPSPPPPPSTPPATIAAAFREHFPDPPYEGDYWLIADARGRVIRSGRGVGGELDTVDFETVDHILTTPRESGGKKSRFIWIQLKP